MSIVFSHIKHQLLTNNDNFYFIFLQQSDFITCDTRIATCKNDRSPAPPCSPLSDKFHHMISYCSVYHHKNGVSLDFYVAILQQHLHIAG